ncbi:MAG: DNA-processing protein DprA [Methylococcales bacterium]|nr:DNA-processing protein DprA [Methylococcales bacterium]
MSAPPDTGALYAWLTLIRTPGLGARTLERVLDVLEPEQLLAESASALRVLGLKAHVIDGLKNPPLARVEQDLAWLDAPGHHFISCRDSRFPPLLTESGDAPVGLFVLGDPEVLMTPQIALVGSRNPSRLGVEQARRFAQTLAGQGFTITSGLALGIDAASHEGALAAGGLTVAVTGTGLDRVYPARHLQLAQSIAGQGALVSEFPPGTTAKAGHFPRRNRIISGLSLAVCVIEAAQRSGSLITARLALEQNRDVFALPGAINNPLAQGCNHLIREGACLVTEPEHIAEQLGHFFQKNGPAIPAQPQSELDLELQTLLNLVMFSPTSMDELVSQTGLAVDEVASRLLQLELSGYVDTTAGGCYIRCR